MNNESKSSFEGSTFANNNVLAKTFRKMLNTLNDYELNLILKEAHDIEKIRIQRKINKGSYELLSGDELELLSKGRIWESIRRYKNRTKCNKKFAREVINFHSSIERKIVSESVSEVLKEDYVAKPLKNFKRVYDVDLEGPQLPTS